MIDRVEGNEIVEGMGLDDEESGGVEADGRREVGERERDGSSEVDVAGISQKSHSCIGPVLDHIP